MWGFCFFGGEVGGLPSPYQPGTGPNTMTTLKKTVD